MVLTLVDTTQIQPYIFGSNRLRENIGASHLVYCATTEWAIDAVKETVRSHNLHSDNSIDATKQIERDAIEAEVWYAAGGNFAVIFRDEAHAKTFTRALSRRVLTDAPNLQIVVTHEPFDWHGDSLTGVLKRAFVQLAEQKRSRTVDAPLLGLGVTVMCRSTGLPAVQVVHPVPSDPMDAYPASAEIVAKIQASDQAHRRLNRMFNQELGDRYAFPREFDELGRAEGEHSYIAVVHADGNGLGDRVTQLGSAPSDNRAFIQQLRQFSVAVEAAAQRALKETLQQLIHFIGRHQQDDEIVYYPYQPTNRKRNPQLSRRFPIRIPLAKDNDGKILLPFRPIVFGGDDVTFVCDGRLGLSLAIEYLKRLEQHTQNLPDGRGKLTASAGVGIVKTHYPFARAYQLADELCKSAKRFRREAMATLAHQDGSYLDWHFALSGLAGDLQTIRAREYQTAEGSLCLRPVTLTGDPNNTSFRTWRVVHEGITKFRSDEWLGRRNKLKALRDALREGKQAVEYFRKKYNQGKNLPNVHSGNVNWQTEGWQGDYCGYFDALELTDWFVPIDEEGQS